MFMRCPVLSVLLEFSLFFAFSVIYKRHLPYSLYEQIGMGVGYCGLVYYENHGHDDSFGIFHTLQLERGREHYDAAIDHYKIHRYATGPSLSEKEDVTAC